MIEKMMIPIHAIVSSEELDGHHVHSAIRAVHLFFKKHLHKEEQQNSKHGHLVHNVLDMTVVDLEDHYINLYGPDLITESTKTEAECQDDADREEEETREEISLLIQTIEATDDRISTVDVVKQLMNVVSPSSRIVGAHKAFNNAVNASSIRRRKQSSTYNEAKNLGG